MKTVAFAALKPKTKFKYDKSAFMCLAKAYHLSPQEGESWSELVNAVCTTTGQLYRFTIETAVRVRDDVKLAVVKKKRKS